jgi:hypothetical protein
MILLILKCKYLAFKKPNTNVASIALNFYYSHQIACTAKEVVKDYEVSMVPTNAEGFSFNKQKLQLLVGLRVVCSLSQSQILTNCTK